MERCYHFFNTGILLKGRHLPKDIMVKNHIKSTDQRLLQLFYSAEQSRCDRVNQLQHEPTRRHNFENHLPVRKPKTPAWQKNLDPPPVPIVVTPGYVLSKSKSKCSVILREDFFDPGTESPVSPSSPLSTRRAVNKGDPERDSLIATLQEQINDLTLYLEEERLNHRQTKQK
ncbi:hypothetical protein LOTGIDRAFT_173104, partial [Lottia gigantea]